MLFGCVCAKKEITMANVWSVCLAVTCVIWVCVCAKKEITMANM
jgi:hypothetical protein